MPADLLLASASPRRAALLRQVGIAFEAAATDVDETPPPGAAPADAALAVARRKADAALALPRREGWTLAADTVVVADGERLVGKPRDALDAVDTLLALAGREHRVLTAVVVDRRADGRRAEAVETTRVAFGPLTRGQAEAYVATGEPMGKAGAYAIQGAAAAFVTSIEGDWSNVVGLPLATTVRLLREVDFPLPAWLRA